MKKHSKTLKQIAYHEAGHAVAYFILKRRFSFITIVPNKKDNTLGQVSSEGLLPNKNLQEAEFYRKKKYESSVEKIVIILFAGGIAESKFAGKRIYKGSGSDYQVATNMISHLCSSNEEIEAYLHLLWIRAKQLFTFSLGENTPYWKAVEELADRLLEEKVIKYQKARTIIKETLKL